MRTSPGLARELVEQEPVGAVRSVFKGNEAVPPSYCLFLKASVTTRVSYIVVLTHNLHVYHF